MVLLRHLLGDVLRRLRLRQGRTLREVSASARVSLGYLSEVERGQKEASSELLSAICTALDTPLSHVLREVSDNFALAELQNSPVLTGPREPVLTGAGPAAMDKPVLNRKQNGVLGPVRLSARSAPLNARNTPVRGGGSQLVRHDPAGLDHVTDTGDVSNMVPV